MCHVLSFFPSFFLSFLPYGTAWSKTVSLGSISDLPCQRLSASGHNVPSLSLSPAFIPSHSLSHRPPFQSCSFPVHLSVRLPMYHFISPSSLLYCVALRQMINIIESGNAKSDVIGCAPEILAPTRTHWKIRGDIKKTQRWRGSGKIQTARPSRTSVCCLWTFCCVNFACALFTVATLTANNNVLIFVSSCANALCWI